MSGKHSNISIFVPHIGCKNKCSFCNQRHITGTFRAPNTDDVKIAVKNALKSKNYNPKTTEIAFFGGSFTAINSNYMVDLLDAASKFVEEGIVSGIRISTRPDAINKEILQILKKYNVNAIELGAQSLDDNVLKMNNRGHNVNDVFNASKLINEFGFELGLQIMTGLYGDDAKTCIKTAEKCIEIGPDTVRIYPTIVLKDTYLAALYEDNIYNPQSLNDAVELASKLYTIFTDNNIRVIRLGLHSIEQKAFVAGPWHPAFSELCLSKLMLEKALKKLNETGKYIIYVNKSDVSKMIGQKKSNILHLQSLGFDCKVIAKEDIAGGQIEITREV